jgi:hypothetical protein
VQQPFFKFSVIAYANKSKKIPLNQVPVVCLQNITLQTIDLSVNK